MDQRYVDLAAAIVRQKILASEARETATSKQPKAVPKMLAGAVIAQYVRCGKAGCRCARGELHGPYWYRKWREGRRQRKTYIRPTDVAVVREACAAERELMAASRLAREIARQDWTRLADLLREYEHA